MAPSRDLAAVGGAAAEALPLRAVFDGARLLLFGGQSNQQPFHGDYWALDVAAGTWTQLDVSRPSPRNLYSLTRTPEDGMFMLFGGRNRGRIQWRSVVVGQQQ